MEWATWQRPVKSSNCQYYYCVRRTSLVKSLGRMHQEQVDVADVEAAKTLVDRCLYAGVICSTTETKNLQDASRRGEPHSTHLSLVVTKISSRGMPELRIALPTSSSVAVKMRIEIVLGVGLKILLTVIRSLRRSICCEYNCSYDASRSRLTLSRCLYPSCKTVSMRTDASLIQNECDDRPSKLSRPFRVSGRRLQARPRNICRQKFDP